jgi:hypothetical protein
MLMATAGLALLLWIACCALLLTARARSRRWLALAAAGPLGFSVIAALADLAPAPGDRYQRFVGGLKTHRRVPFELAVFLAVWTVAYEAIVLERELAIRLESARTGTPIATIVAQQTAASGMWAAGEGFQILYLVPLLYLLWPIGFNLASRLFATRSRA